MRYRPGIARFVRLAAVCGLIIIVVVVVVAIVRSTKKGEREAEKSISDERVAVSARAEARAEHIEYLEFKSGTLKSEVRARRSLLSRRNWLYLEKVEFTFFNERNETDFRVSANQAIVNPDKNVLCFAGPIEIRTNGLNLLIEFFEDAAGLLSEIIEKNEKLDSSGRLPALMVYDETRDEVRLNGKFNIKTTTQAKTGQAPLQQIGGDELVFSRRQGIGEVKAGRIVLDREKTGQADLIRFKLDAENRSFEIVELAGEAKLTLKSENRQFPYNLELRADEVKLFFARGKPSVSAVEASRAVRIIQTEAEEVFDLNAGNLDLLLNSAGRVENLMAVGTISLKYRKNGSEFLVSGLRLTLPSHERNITIDGVSDSPASAETQKLFIQGESLSLDRSNLNFKVKNQVSGFLKPDKDRAGNFFDGDAAVFFAGTSAVGSSDGKTFNLEGMARVWQSLFSIMASSFELDRQTRVIRAAGQVTSIFSYAAYGEKPASFEDSVVMFKAGELRIEETTWQLVFNNSVSFLIKGAELFSDRMKLVFSSEKRTIERLESEGNIRLIYGGAEIRSDQAVFNASDETFTLMKNALLTDKSLGTIRGDKLTLVLSDGRILVGKEGKGRSVVLLKREK